MKKPGTLRYRALKIHRNVIKVCWRSEMAKRPVGSTWCGLQEPQVLLWPQALLPLSWQ